MQRDAMSGWSAYSPPLPRYAVGEGGGEGARGVVTRSKANTERVRAHPESARPLTLTLSHGVPRERGPEGRWGGDGGSALGATLAAGAEVVAAGEAVVVAFAVAAAGASDRDCRCDQQGQRERPVRDARCRVMASRPGVIDVGEPEETMTDLDAFIRGEADIDGRERPGRVPPTLCREPSVPGGVDRIENDSSLLGGNREPSTELPVPKPIHPPVAAHPHPRHGGQEQQRPHDDDGAKAAFHD